MTSKAKEIIIPPAGIFRVVFLYVGQGDAALLAVPDGEQFKFILFDNNIDKSAGGIDTERLLKDLLDDGLDVFMNSHPHKDHTEGIEAIHKAVKVKEIWHSGHVPGKEHDDAYQEMRRVIKAIGNENEYKFFGSNTQNKVRRSDGKTKVIKKLGDVHFQVLAPAEYLCEEIEEEEPKVRYRRIHEHCAVLRFSYGNPLRHVLMTGDADRRAWENHIMGYHKENGKADVLSAVHHGSRTFFKFPGNDEDVYEEHIKAIAPDYLVLSAPTREESAHDHPHEDALKLYKKHVKEENIFHLGKNRVSVIVDISPNGNLTMEIDSELFEAYGFKDDKERENNSGRNAFTIGTTTRLDRKPMGSI
jgi:beta-lactamase superfamily II metal-dependent hydrolase